MLEIFRVRDRLMDTEDVRSVRDQYKLDFFRRGHLYRDESLVKCLVLNETDDFRLGKYESLLLEYLRLGD